jgi:hypothetical protein
MKYKFYGIMAGLNIVACGQELLHKNGSLAMIYIFFAIFFLWHSASYFVARK